ncbi:DUF4123 domain-containing protein [Martelella mangrovi]|uniref:DUF4123 domain-containing protein n=1 Tax=Martelella mangrovi TaxID=1397477 RepID=A0ABV2IGG4_9HYPH
MNSPMPSRSPWLGWCHLHRMETSEDFETHAAVLCDSRDDFDAVLREHAQSLGLILMWTQDVRPVTDWIKVNPKLIGVGGNLARAVHPAHKVELEPLTAMENPNVDAAQQDYLSIDEIEGVEPLDQQMGQWPRKTVPDKLYEPLFGQPQPTEAEIAAFGSAEAVPKMKTFAILDAAKMPYLLTSHLGSSELRYQPLFQGDAAEELKEVAPYLAELKDENSFTRKLFTSQKAMGLWERSSASSSAPTPPSRR